MQRELKFYNVNLVDLRDTVHKYDLQSLYRAVNALNGDTFDKIGVLGEIQIGDQGREYVELEHVSHTIDEFKIVDGMVLGNVRILDTPAGRIVRNSLVGSRKQNNDMLICGFTMASIVDIETSGYVVDRIVAFHLSPEKSPIMRIVDWSGEQPLRELNRKRGAIPVKELPVQESCGDFGSCGSTGVDYVSQVAVPYMVYQVITEPERTVVETDKIFPCEMIESRTVESTYTCSASTETGGSSGDSGSGYSD